MLVLPRGPVGVAWPGGAALGAGLDPDERARLNDFSSPNARARFGLTRAAARALVAESLGVDPAAVRFAIDAHGKPRLTAPAGHELWFNVSHTEGFALVALSRVGPVGVDVELARPRRRLQQLAAHVLAPSDATLWDGADEAALVDRFYRVWCAKEAVLKADGRGISAGVANVELGEICEGAARIRGRSVAQGSATEVPAAVWHVLQLALPEPYRGAVAFPAAALAGRS